MKPVTIVAIGLSEGGLAPLQKFFDYTPLDKTAYVVLAHLPQTSRSELGRILEKHSGLSIVQATTGDVLSSNMVYVLAQNKFLTIHRNQLMVSNQASNSQSLVTDVFLASLAKNRHSKIAAVLLSGNSPDGTKGIAAVKESNGIVLVQDPASSEYPQMPASAISSGYADYILQPEQMPAMLARWTENKLLPVPYAAASATFKERNRKHVLRQMGLAIRQARIHKKISQQELAALAGMQKASVSRMESGSNNMTMLSLFKIATVLDVKITDFF